MDECIIEKELVGALNQFLNFLCIMLISKKLHKEGPTEFELQPTAIISIQSRCNV